MPRTSQLQTNFNAGELSPNIDGRTDYPPYFNGSLTLENFCPHPQGWMYRRKGTQFVAEVKDSSKKTAIIPFKYNIDQVILIEMGAGYFRFFSAQAPILSSGVPYEISNTFTEAMLENVRYVQKDDVIFMVHPTAGIFKLIRLANNNWTFNALTLTKGPFMDENIINLNTLTITGTYTKGGTSTLTATGHTPFTANHVGSLWKVTNGTDVAYLKVTAFTSSTIVTCENVEAIPSSLQATARSTWSEGEFSAARSYPRAISFHEQRLVLAGSLNATQRLWFSKSNGDFENFETGSTVDFGFNKTIAATSNDSILWLFSDEVLFIGTTEGIWRAKASANASALSNTDFGVKRQIAFGSEWVVPVYADDSPFYLQRGRQKVRAIGYASSRDRYAAQDATIKSDHITGNGLKSFAYQQNPVSTIWAVREDGQACCFVYESAQEVTCWYRVKTNGVIEYIATLPSSSTYDEIYFVVKRTINGQTKRFIEVIEPTFDYSNLGGVFVDSSLTYNGIKDVSITLSSASGSIAITTESGEMLTTESGVALTTEESPVTITASSAIFSAGDVGKQIHEITGKGRASIISYTNSTTVGVDIIELFSASTISSGDWGIAVKEVSGLTHLLNTSVSICGDGATFPDKVVDGTGKVTIGEFSVVIHVGLKYESIRKSMPIEMDRLSGLIGSSQGKFRRIDTLLVNFFNTRGGELLDTNSNLLTTINSRSLVDAMDKAPALTSENIKIDLPTDWDTALTTTLRQSEPQPMNVKTITYFVSVNDF